MGKIIPRLLDLEIDVRGLRVLSEESDPRRKIVVCMEDEPRTVARSIEILPWREFFRRLWDGELLVCGR